MLIDVLFAVIVVEAITNLLTKSDIFTKFRKFLFIRKDKRFFRFFSSIFECPYCMSVWVGWLIAIIYWYDLLLSIFFFGLVLHRLANVFHHVVDRIWGDTV